MYETEYDLQKNTDHHSNAIKILIYFVLIPLLILTIILVIYFAFTHRDNRYFLCHQGECKKCPSSDSNPECKRGSKSDCQKNCKAPPTPAPNLRYNCVGTSDNNILKTFMMKDPTGNQTADSTCHIKQKGWSIKNNQCILDERSPKYDSLYDCLNNNNNDNHLYSCVADNSGNTFCSPNSLGNLSKSDCNSNCNSDNYGWGISVDNKCILGVGHGNYHNQSSCINSLLPENKSGCLGYYDKSGNIVTECVSLPNGTLSHKDCKNYACDPLNSNWMPNQYGYGCVYADTGTKYPYTLKQCLDGLTPQRFHA